VTQIHEIHDAENEGQTGGNEEEQQRKLNTIQRLLDQKRHDAVSG
jgi:hypothetical protein